MLEIAGFTVITGDEAYSSAQAKIERLILDEMADSNC